MAHLSGKYQYPDSEALTVGNYFHTALESDEAHEEFRTANLEKIFKYKVDKATGEPIITGKYAPYVKADEMIRACIEDPLISSLIAMDGESERIMTGEIFGIKWKIALDKYIPDKRLIIDWKTAADLTKTEYNPSIGERESFLEALGYLMRAAVYTEIERQNANAEDDARFIIIAVSKQDPPDKGAYLLNHRDRYDWELDQVRDKLMRIISVKSGRERPRRCGSCHYCRSTKKLTKIVPYYVLTPKFREEKEEEYDDAYLAAADMEDTQAEAIREVLSPLQSGDPVDI
jgi:hypothetical protein